MVEHDAYGAIRILRDRGRKMKKPKLSGILTMVYTDEYRDPCLIECRAKKGVKGLINEIQRLADGLSLMWDETPPIFIDYKGDFETEIKIEFKDRFDQARKLYAVC